MPTLTPQGSSPGLVPGGVPSRARSIGPPRWNAQRRGNKSHTQRRAWGPPAFTVFPSVHHKRSSGKWFVHFRGECGCSLSFFPGCRSFGLPVQDTGLILCRNLFFFWCQLSRWAWCNQFQLTLTSKNVRPRAAIELVWWLYCKVTPTVDSTYTYLCTVVATLWRVTKNDAGNMLH